MENRNYNRERTNGYNNNRNSRIINKIEVPLSAYYKDKSEIFLPDKKAHNLAKKIKSLPPHQLRKILNQAKESIAEYDKKGEAGLNIAKNKLFALLPLTAYNAARSEKKFDFNELFEFLVEHINEKSIVTFDDIKIFDELFTSIIAYHKYENVGLGRK